MRPLLVALVGLALFAPTASAARVTQVYIDCGCDPSSGAPGTSGIVIHAAPGEQNRITVRRRPKGALVTDEGAPLAGNCLRVNGATQFCPGELEDGVKAFLRDGNDTLTVVGVNGFMHGGPGDDLLYGRGALYFVDGGAGADRMEVGPQGEGYISYEHRREGVTVRLNDTPDDGAAGEHDDVRGRIVNITGGEGDDVLEGGAATKLINGNDGADVLRGGRGDEEIGGGAGDDVIDGDAGDDRLSGQAGADLLRGGDGRDVASYRLVGDPVRVTIGDGPNDGAEGEGDDVAGDVEGVEGGDGDDVLVGDERPNSLDGGAGVDRLTGADGADTLIGREEADELDPGPGRDRIIASGPNILRLADGEADSVRCRDQAPAIDFDSLDTFKRCASAAYLWAWYGPDRRGRMRLVIACDDDATQPCTGELTLRRDGQDATRAIPVGPLAAGRRVWMRVRLRGGRLRRRECVGAVIVTTRPDVPTTTRIVQRNLSCRRGL